MNLYQQVKKTFNHICHGLGCAKLLFCMTVSSAQLKTAEATTKDVL